MIFALAGNQNCGKTTLFNALTGSNQHVGNFPGVTVDQKSGEVREHKECTVVDLPGIYSLRTYTQEEIVTRDYILNQKPDGIINIVDATNIERNLYLTLQLLELRVPMVLALNMMDEVRANGGTIDVQKLSDDLGIPVVPITAAKGEGVSELMDRAVETAKNRVLPKVYDFCAANSPVHRCVHAVVHLIEDHAERLGLPPRFCATKLIEGDRDMADRLVLDQNERELLEHCIVQMETENGLDRNASLADMRYTFIEQVTADAVVKCHESKEHKRSVAWDRVLTGKYTALPVFFGVMLLIFWLTFDVIGQGLSDLLALGIDYVTAGVDGALTAYGINPVVHSLIIDGIFAGVGSVLSFLPIRSGLTGTTTNFKDRQVLHWQHLPVPLRTFRDVHIPNHANIRVMDFHRLAGVFGPLHILLMHHDFLNKQPQQLRRQLLNVCVAFGPGNEVVCAGHRGLQFGDLPLLLRDGSFQLLLLRHITGGEGLELLRGDAAQYAVLIQSLEDGLQFRLALFHP